MKKYFKYILMALVAVIFIGTFVFLYIKSQPQPEVYDEFTLQRMDIRKTTVVTGKIEPRNEVNVKPQISGIITEILKEAGETVQEGEVIAKVKVIPDMGSLSAAQSRLRLAEINRKQAQTDYDREKTLFDKGLVAADEYDKIAQALRQAREEVDAHPLHHHRLDTRHPREGGQFGDSCQHLQRRNNHRHRCQHERPHLPW